MIQGKRIVLKILEQQDIPELFELLSNPDVNETLCLNIAEMTPANCVNYVAQTMPGTMYLIFGVYHKDSGEFLGFVSVTNIHSVNRTAHLQQGAIKPSVWSEGYGEEAGFLLIRHLLLDRNIRRVTADSISGNDASLNAAKRVGFKHEGTQRKSLYLKGSWVSVKNLGLLKKEFNWSLFENEEIEDGTD